MQDTTAALQLSGFRALVGNIVHLGALLQQLALGVRSAQHLQSFRIAVLERTALPVQSSIQHAPLDTIAMTRHIG